MNSAKILKADPQNPAPEIIQEAAKVLSAGGLVIIPTETVYGVAADSRNAQALKKLCEIKKRPKDKPFPLLIENRARLETLAKNIPTAAYKLMDKFWPGPLTLILEAKAGGSIGLRMPDHQLALRIISATDAVLACPSANISGKKAPQEIAAAIKELDGLVDLAVDAGPARLGIESTVVDLTQKEPRVLRIGAIKKEEIESVTAKKNVLFVCTGNSCRSVMAEALLAKILRQNNRSDVEVNSAGVAALQGTGATEPTRDILAREGINIPSHHARRLTREMADSSDIILVMERLHEEMILGFAPEVKNRLFLLKEFANPVRNAHLGLEKISNGAKINGGSMDIKDPIGRDAAFYQDTFAVIKQAVEKVAELI